MTWLEITLVTLCVVLVVLPPKWDPLIIWKEQNERKRRDKI